MRSVLNSSEGELPRLGTGVWREPLLLALSTLATYIAVAKIAVANHDWEPT
jgi:hypothetical protein